MKIFFGAIVLSIALGIAVDLITANVAVDYFAVYHPHVVSSTSPWVLALVWGVGASWWAGAIGGAILAFYNWRLRPRVPSDIVLRWVRNACAVIWCTMIGIVGIVYVYGGLEPVTERRESFEYDRRLIAVAITHGGEYVFAAIAIAIVISLMRRYSKNLAV